MEIVLRDAIVERLAKHHYIRNTQHGFIRGRSCLTNLLEYLEVLTKWYRLAKHPAGSLSSLVCLRGVC